MLFGERHAEVGDFPVVGVGYRAPVLPGTNAMGRSSASRRSSPAHENRVRVGALEAAAVARVPPPRRGTRATQLGLRVGAGWTPPGPLGRSRSFSQTRQRRRQSTRANRAKYDRTEISH